MKYKRHIGNVKVMTEAIKNFRKSLTELTTELQNEVDKLDDKSLYDENICQSKIEYLEGLINDYKGIDDNLVETLTSIDFAKISIQTLFNLDCILSRGPMKKEGCK